MWSLRGSAIGSERGARTDSPANISPHDRPDRLMHEHRNALRLDLPVGRRLDTDTDRCPRVRDHYVGRLNGQVCAGAETAREPQIERAPLRQRGSSARWIEPELSSVDQE